MSVSCSNQAGGNANVQVRSDSDKAAVIWQFATMIKPSEDGKLQDIFVRRKLNIISVFFFQS